MQDAEELVERASRGDESARQELLARNRERLRQMVSVHMDQRLCQRVDASDVVQEVFLRAWQELPDYLRDRPLPFYPWLRALAWNRLVELFRFHVQAEKRSVTRERPLNLASPPDHSSRSLASRLAAGVASPSTKLMREELRSRVERALDRLPEHYREILVLHYLEDLSLEEAAAVLAVPRETAKKRHLRGLRELRRLLAGESGSELA